MESNKVEKIARLAKEKDELNELIEWHSDKVFVFADIKIEMSSPMHSQLLGVFQNRLKYVESELEAE